MLRGGGHTWRPGREQNFHAGNIPTPSRTVKFRWREYPDIRPQRVKSWRYRMARQKINVVMPHMHRPTANESILIFYEPFRDAAFFPRGSIWIGSLALQRCYTHIHFTWGDGSAIRLRVSFFLLDLLLVSPLRPIHPSFSLLIFFLLSITCRPKSWPTRPNCRPVPYAQRAPFSARS